MSERSGCFLDGLTVEALDCLLAQPGGDGPRIDSLIFTMTNGVQATIKAYEDSGVAYLKLYEGVKL